MKTTIKTHYIVNVWEKYSMQLLYKNPELKGSTINKIKNHNIYLVDEKGKKKIVHSYPKFRQIVDEFFIAAKDAVIEGEAIRLPHRVGKICGKRIERNHNKRLINWDRSNMYREWDEEQKKWIYQKLIFRTEDDYCRIGFFKFGHTKNETVYAFVPTENTASGCGFKQQFAKALTSNPLLKFKYPYYPLK